MILIKCLCLIFETVIVLGTNINVRKGKGRVFEYIKSLS